MNIDINNDNNSLRVIAQNGDCFFVTSNPNATIDNIFTNGFVVTNDGKIIVENVSIGTLTRNEPWHRLDGKYDDYIKPKNSDYIKNALTGAVVGDACSLQYKSLSREKIANLLSNCEILPDTNSDFVSDNNMSLIIATAKSVMPIDGIVYNPKVNNRNELLIKVLPIAIYCITKELNNLDIYQIISKNVSIDYANEIEIMACYMYIIFMKEAIRTKNSLLALKKIIYEDYTPFFSKETIAVFKKINNPNFNLNFNDIGETKSIVEILEGVIYSLFIGNNYREVIEICIKLGGDTNIRACIAGSLAGVIYGYDDIPKEWLNDGNIKLKTKILLDVIKEQKQVGKIK